MASEKERHINIPVFIPHLGCPNMCVFCNQRYISGVSEYNPADAKREIDTVLGETFGKNIKKEIAFFGGSFTGIDFQLMTDLLDMAQGYVDSGYVDGIRMSTRPDYINESIIEVLKKYTISAVELGIQSLDSNVLSVSKRGHCAADSEKAVSLLVKAGFDTVGQMMIGLPGSTRESEIHCARTMTEWGISGTRIYPTIVFHGTELEKMMEKGDYSPLSVTEAVSRTADVYEIFLESGVECLRIGLCDSDVIHSDDTFAAGPNHPSIGELVYSEIYRRIITRKLGNNNYSEKNCVVSVPKNDISMAIGQHKSNKEYLLEHYGFKTVKFVTGKDNTRFSIDINID